MFLQLDVAYGLGLLLSTICSVTLVENILAQVSLMLTMMVNLGDRCVVLGFVTAQGSV